MGKLAFLTGITGQDGSYLAEFLINKGYKVHGIVRRVALDNQTHRLWRIKHLLEKTTLHGASLESYASICKIINQIKPDEVYHLAAQSYVGASFDQPIISGEITGIAVTKILESIRIINTKIKFYKASSSELYGNTPYETLDEKTPFYPRSPYAVSKLYSFWISKIYRDGYNMFCSNGILFNH